MQRGSEHHNAVHDGLDNDIEWSTIQVNIRSNGESPRQVSPQRSLSPLAGRFAFSWHRAAQDTPEGNTGEASAEDTSTDRRVHSAAAADDGPPEQLAEYMHTGPGPLEEGLAIARCWGLSDRVHGSNCALM